MSRGRLAVPRGRAARPHRRDRRRACSATPTCSPGASSAATSCASRGRVERFRDELQVELARDRPRAPRARPTRPRSCPSPTATSTSSTASSSTSLGEVHDPGFARAAGRAARRRRAARGAGAARRARAPATTPTSAACSSTRSRSARSRSRPARCTRGWTSDLLITAALVHDLGKTREFTLRRRDRPHRRGPAARPRRARRCALLAPARRGDRPGRRRAASRSRTACSPTTVPTPRPAGASARPRRSRCTASTRSTPRVKGALTPGLG